MDMLYEDYQDYVDSICEQMAVGDYLFWLNLHSVDLLKSNTTLYTNIHNEGNENEIL